MRTGSANVLLILIVGLALGAMTWVGLDLRSQTAHEARAAEFQHLVGGLGFGPATELSPCPRSFDPRLECSCAQNQGPIPGGTYFCPQHGCSVLAYPPCPHAAVLESDKNAQVR